MRFLEEWTSVRHFPSIEGSDFFGDTEKTHAPVGEIPSRCTPAFPSSRRSIPEKFTALAGVSEQLWTRFGGTRPLWRNPALRAWPALTRLDGSRACRVRGTACRGARRRLLKRVADRRVVHA